MLQTKLVQTQSFRPKVDHLTFLRGDATEETAVFNTASGTPIIMTMVAYTANGIISDPRIVPRHEFRCVLYTGPHTTALAW